MRGPGQGTLKFSTASIDLQFLPSSHINETFVGGAKSLEKVGSVVSSFSDGSKLRGRIGGGYFYRDIVVQLSAGSRKLQSRSAC